MNNINERLTYFSTSEFAYHLVIFLVLLFACICVFTAFFILNLHRSFHKNRIYFQKSSERVRNSLQYFYEEIDNPKTNVKKLVQKTFGYKFFRSKQAQKMLKRLIVDCHKSTESETEKIKLEKLFRLLGFENLIIKNIRHKHWYPKSIAIHIAGEMRMKNLYTQIEGMVDLKHRILRNEARFSAIRLAPENPLEFLKNVQFKVSNWEQLSIIDCLQKYRKEDIPPMGEYLYHYHESIVILALKIILVFKQNDQAEEVMKCFDRNKSLAIRKQSIITMGNFKNKNYIPYLIEKLYDADNIEKQLLCLNAIWTTGIYKEHIDEIIPFLYENEYELVYYATLCIKTCDEGIHLLNEVIYTQNEIQKSAVVYGLKYDPHLTNL